MASNNSDDEAFGITFLLCIFAIPIALMMAFAACLLTVVCIFTWKKGFPLGQSRVNPEEFVGGGICGSALLIGFIIFCDYLCDHSFSGEWWRNFWLAGYTLGSVGPLVYAFVEENFDGART